MNISSSIHQITFNGFPLLSNVPWARFFGGEDIEEQLSSNDWRSKRFFYLLTFSIMCQVIQIIVKKINCRQFATSYINSVRENMLNNFLNIFNSKVSIISFVLVIVLEIFNVSLFGVLKDSYLLSQIYVLAIYVVVLLASCLPYLGYPLR